LILNRLKPKKVPFRIPDDSLLPSVSFIVAAYNEADCIAQKITNSLDLDYPREKIEFLFISDGSTDGTDSIVRQYPSIRSLHQPQRNGKSAALNRAVLEAHNHILIFCDANTLLNKAAIRNIVRHYDNPTVGGVAGEKKVLPATAGHDQVGEGEGLYWKYESFLKKEDAAFYSVVGAAGELLSFRSSLYEPLSHNIILDDFVSSLKVTQKGYRFAYEPDAYAIELPSFSLHDEKKRKIRIAAGGFQAIFLLTSLLAVWKYPRLSFLYVSHRLMRWAVSPFCMIFAFIANGMLLLTNPSPIYASLFILQCCFYGTAALAAIFPTIQNRSKLIKLAYYFVFMNACTILGFFRFLKGSQSAVWEKAKRAQTA
jgi:cellulose synthase/poly-beta-1,6-N-acetylglucosamine synthase-like glycosyltransferase